MQVVIVAGRGPCPKKYFTMSHQVDIGYYRVNLLLVMAAGGG